MNGQAPDGEFNGDSFYHNNNKEPHSTAQEFVAADASGAPHDDESGIIHYMDAPMVRTLYVLCSARSLKQCGSLLGLLWGFYG
jgi:hypothetical protein